MRGHVVKRGRNRYSLVLELSEGGKRKQKWIAFRGNKKDAEAKLVEVLHQANSGAFILPRKVTVGQFLEYWLKTYCVPNLRPRTTEGYRDIVCSHLIPNLGQIHLAELTPDRIQELYSRLLKEGRRQGEGSLSPRTIGIYHQCLHRALAIAVEWELLLRNPADKVHPPQSYREIVPLDATGARKALEATKGTAYYVATFLAIYTAMRRSEVLGLQWRDIDLTVGQIEVRRTLHMTSDRKIDIQPPKSKKGRRPISLTPATVAMLKEHYEDQRRIRAELGTTLQPEDWVICDPDGSPLLPERVTRAWIRLRNKLGIKQRWHDLRHTHATGLLEQKTSPKIVQERLGHASIKTTMDTYSHIMPTIQEGAAQSFDDWMDSNK